MANILLIEDTRECQILVKETLLKVANVKIASSLQEARPMLAQGTFDLVLLDLGLPDGDGMKFFSSLRKKLGTYSHYVESEVGIGYRLNTARSEKVKAVA